MEKLVIIDGNSLLFRAYYAMMRPMVTKDGIHTQGIYGFINMLNKIKTEFPSDYLAVAFDMKAKTFRHEYYPEYKAGRKKTPIELLSEIPLIHEVLDAMNIEILEIERFEADDIIGTITKKATEKSIASTIITGDKDELQLIDENVNVVLTKKGISEFELYDVKKMNEVYGLTPLQFIDLKGLMGDTSDNIPGIPGVGEKKGLSLLLEYNSLENVIEHADQIKGKMGEKIRDNIDLAIMSKKLATINCDVPISYSFEDMKLQEPNYEKLIEIYQKLEFNTFIAKLRKSGKADSFDIEGERDINEELKNIKAISFEEALKHKEEEAIIDIATDNNHLCSPKLLYLVLFIPSIKGICIKEITDNDVEIVLGNIRNAKYKMVGNDFNHQLYSLKYYTDYSGSIIHDTKVAEYLIDPNRSKYSIKKMSLKHCSFIVDEKIDNPNELDVIKDKELIMARIYSIYNIYIEQKKILDSLNLRSLFDEIEIPLINVMVDMELNGVAVKSETLITQGKELSDKIESLESKVFEECGEKFNINSPKQLGQILFEKLDIPYPKGAKSKKSGNYSTGVDVLDKLKNEYPVVESILEYRKYTKLKSTYIDGLLDLVADDGKIHPHFNQTVAATGRLSCTEPNLQNIPIRDEYGRGIRKAFVPSKDGNVFIGADYSQIELRILAALSNDTVLIDAFNKGEDIHRLTASRVFEIPMDEVTPLDRIKAKAVNFGVIYGMSGFGLSEELKISRKEAQEYIEEYFEKHQAVKEYLDSQVQEGKEKGQVTTMFGRIRQIPEFSSRNYMERQLASRLAMNTPIQGSAADIIKIAMNKVYDELKEKHMKSKLVLQIHDELIVEAVPEEKEQAEELLKRNMESAVDISVDMICDLNQGLSWFDLK